jgi:alcohol dehydrogenase class IV
MYKQNFHQNEQELIVLQRFTVPRDIYFGKDAILELKKLNSFKRPFIVADDAMVKLGWLDMLIRLMNEAGMENITCFTQVEAEPSVETVKAGARSMTENSSDVIIAIGGGSVLDAAKAMWVFYEHPDLSFEDILNKPLPPLRKKAIMVAIPSTSGTGSEVTAYSVITDHATKIKYPIADFNITPDVAILDSDLTTTMPPALVAYTGMDALTHAIEAYVSLERSRFTRPLSIHAISIIVSYLEDSFAGDADARDEIHVASCLAGISFTNAQLGICHSIAHKAGGLFGIPHGLCNSILLPFVIEYNKKNHAALRHYANIARRMGYDGDRDKHLVISLVREVRTLAENLDLPLTFADAGVNEFKLDNFKREIAENAFLDPCTLSNPRETSPDDLGRILESAYYGKPVVF